MNSLDQITKTALLAALAGAASAGLGQNALVFDAQGDGVTAQSSTRHLTRLGMNRWLDEETIATNLDIYENREAIAALAEWIGPGPGNIAPIMAGDASWLDRMREEASTQFAQNGGLDLPPVVLLANDARRVTNPIHDQGGHDTFGDAPWLQLWPFLY